MSCPSMTFDGYCLFTNICDWFGVHSENCVILVSFLALFDYSSDLKNFFIYYSVNFFAIISKKVIKMTYDIFFISFGIFSPILYIFVSIQININI